VRARNGAPLRATFGADDGTRRHDTLLERLVPAFFLAAPAAPCVAPVDVLPLEQLTAIRVDPCVSDVSDVSSASSAGSF